MIKKTMCIIDSGYNKDSISTDTNIIGEIGVRRLDNGRIEFENDASDQIGHGTAVLSIISQYSKNANIFIIKIFYDELCCDEEILEIALEYIYNNIDCGILNISCGTCLLENIDALEGILSKLSKKDILVVSAFDNNGSISFPACFSSVIGVDSDPICKKHDDIVYVKNSIIDIFGFGGTQRVPWLEPKYIFVSGASFACAHISSILYNSNCLIKKDAMSYLKMNCIENITFDTIVDSTNIIPNISKAAIIPYNKEIHSLIKFNKLLNFSLLGIYDFAKLGNVNRQVKTYLSDEVINVQNINNLPWDDCFDTLIVGHLNEISQILKRDLYKDIIELCIEHKKNIYSFDPLDKYITLYENKIDVNWPRLVPTNGNHFGKLYSIAKPILGVFGTSSSQGKFTLQLFLRNMFKKRGYNVGQIGSEPSSLLYGMDYAIHFGYNGNLRLGRFEFIEIVNNMLNEIQIKGIDIIIAGSQSNTIPYAVLNEKYLTIPQIDFLFGLNPDRIILCVNPHDDLAYIKRTISALESLVECKIIAIVIFPMGYEGKWTFGGAKKMLSNKQLENVKMYLSQEIKLPCFILGEDKEMDKLFDIIINSFTQGDENL